MDKHFLNRAFTMFCVLCALFFAAVLRTVSLHKSNYAKAGNSSAYRTVTISSLRPDMYDCNGEKLTGTRTVKKGAVQSDTESYNALRRIFSGEAFERIRPSLEKGYPISVELPFDPLCRSITAFDIPLRYGGCCEHLTGYTDETGENGITGIEKSFDTFFKENTGSLSVTYDIDASGRVLSVRGIRDEREEMNGVGVYLTIDKSMQLAAERAMDEKGITSGAAVVLDVKTGDVKALVSRPGYDRYHIADAMAAADSPLLNKALCAYAAGSVFKPLVAAAGLENGVGEDLLTECKGECTLSDTTFSCYGKTAHGSVDLPAALIQSCNIYFIRYASLMQPDTLLSLCDRLGLGKETELCDDISGEAGYLPNKAELTNPGDYANLSFGQGKLTVTPLQLAAAYAALISDGVYKQPRLILGTYDRNGEFAETPESAKTEVLSKKTVKRLREMLHRVTEEGCTAAKPFFTDAGGKTGTAQSGIYDDTGEINRTWYAGFFPYEDPHYVAVILNENGTSGSKDCAPVFRLLADLYTQRQKDE